MPLPPSSSVVGAWAAEKAGFVQLSRHHPSTREARPPTGHRQPLLLKSFSRLCRSEGEDNKRVREPCGVKAVPRNTKSSTLVSMARDQYHQVLAWPSHAVNNGCTQWEMYNIRGSAESLFCQGGIQLAEQGCFA